MPPDLHDQQSARPSPAGADHAGRSPRRAGSYRLVLVAGEPPAARRGTRTTRSGRPRRTLPPRTVAPESHRPHGSYAKYVVERCGCGPCRAAKRDYERRRQRAMRRPDQVWAPYVPAGNARRHLADLAAAGVGLKQVAKVSGIGHGVLSKIVYGDPARGMAPSRRVRQTTARRIMAVTTADLAGGARIDAAATWALIDQLTAAGYTKTWIARRIGRTLNNLRRRPQVTATTAAAVADLHHRHINQPATPRASRWTPR
jgi:hypothetical protein